MSMQMLLTVNVKAGHDEVIYNEVKKSSARMLSGIVKITILQEKSDVFVYADAQESFLDLASLLQNQPGVADTKLEVMKVFESRSDFIEGEFECAIYFNTTNHSHNDKVLKELKKIAKIRGWKIRTLGKIYTFESDGFIWITADEEPYDIVTAIRKDITSIEDTEWYNIGLIEYLNK